MTLSHGRTYRPSVSIVTKVGRASQMYSLPARGFCAAVLPLPSVGEVDQVVPDDLAAVALLPGCRAC